MLSRKVLASLRVAAGLLCYGLTRRTPAFAFQGMIRLFTLTAGRSNDVLSAWIRKWKRRYRFEHNAGVLKLENGEALHKAAEELRAKGYCVFDACVPPDLCDRLLAYALAHPCAPRALDGQGKPRPVPGPYPRSAPDAIVYDFTPGDLVNNADVQRLMGDLSILSLVQEYLGVPPVLDAVNMWWMTGYSVQPDRNAAQLYHFDMDRIRWLKIFIYLTDMTADSGPHCFVEGSHLSGGIPQHFLSRGYARLSDEDVATSYPADSVKEFVGKRGTIIVEDTRGLHKGKPVVSGDRLMFEMEFSNSLFGAPRPQLGTIREFHEPSFRDFVSLHPDIFACWPESFRQRSAASGHGISPRD